MYVRASFFLISDSLTTIGTRKLARILDLVIFVACHRRALLKLAPHFNFLNVAIQQSGSSYPLSLLKRASSGVVRMLSASFMTSYTVRLAHCNIFLSAQLIGWSFAQACSAMADLSGRHLVQASLCY